MDTQELYNTWNIDKTPENLAKVMAGLEPSIRSEIQRYSGPKPLLMGKGKEYAINAVRTYNPESGASLRSWVTTNLQQLTRYSTQLKPVYVPEVANRRAAELRKIRAELSESLGRDPDDHEIADRMGISKKRVQELTNAGDYMTEGVYDSDDDNADNAPDVSGYNRVALAQDVVYGELDDRDRAIFDFKTGLHGSSVLQNAEIARRLGVSPAYISQRSEIIAKRITDLVDGGLGT